MATEGDKDNHFLCQLKMEGQIYCAHTVKLTAPGLVIDKVGTEATELTYSFAAGQGLTSQDVGILGHNPGDYYLFADITSPYYVSANGLKVKKDKIKIKILDSTPDGWSGTDHGLQCNGGPTVWTEPDLTYKYTHLAGPNQNILFYAKINGGSFETLGIRMSGAASGTGQSSPSVPYTFVITTPGVYTFQVFADAKFAQSGTLGTSVITAQKTIGSFAPETVSPKRRGVIWSPASITVATPYNQAIPTTNALPIIEEYRSGTLPITVTKITYDGSNSGISFAANGKSVLASGSFLNPPGGTFATFECRVMNILGAPYAGVNGSISKV